MTLTNLNLQFAYVSFNRSHNRLLPVHDNIQDNLGQFDTITHP